MPITKGFKALVNEAMSQITTHSVEEARRRAESGKATLIDIRDIRELEHSGRVPNAFHAPRGMLEFWVDPNRPTTNRFLPTKIPSSSCFAVPAGAAP